ncbi:MAG: histidine kinase dimerization/phosphoacceptor domain-containing protein, partial [Chloroflexota bacterium]|nr:histidine kinase dimerization/phosphoacceptor domain-containing protein [Chloroflexota bacterium]
MKHIRHIHPLNLFLLVWFVIILWNSWSPVAYITYGSLLVVFTLLMILHFAIYWIMLSLKMRRSFQWLSLLTQAGFVLLLTQITQIAAIALALSLALILVAIDTLKLVRPIIIAIGSYLVLFVLYVYTFGSQIRWEFLWRGDGNSLTILTLFVSPVLALYLLQEHLAHKRTQSLLRELDIAHAQLSAYALHVEDLTMITERQRIARDLHDTLVQGVAGLIMQLDVVNTQLQNRRIERAQEN